METRDAAPAETNLPRRAEVLFAASVAALAIFMAAFLLSSQPLGVVGEWVWNRSGVRPDSDRAVAPLLALLVYCAAVVVGGRLLRRSRAWAVVLLPSLVAGAAGLQIVCLDLPAPPFGLERWAISLANPGSSGYLNVAQRVQDFNGFARSYETWVAEQDSFHIGTHPPGLVLLNRVGLEWFGRHPLKARQLVETMPARFQSGLAVVGSNGPPGWAEQGTLVGLSLLALVLVAGTVIPIYALVRLEFPAPVAFWCSALWPLVPGPLWFLPVSDCMFPFLSASIVALILWSHRSGLHLLAVLAGALWTLGMFVSLAFLAVFPLAVGPLLPTLLAGSGTQRWRLVVSLLAFAAGAVLPIEGLWSLWRMNLPAIWRINLEKHAGFYAHMPRSYAVWIWVNLIEFGFVLGPAGVLATVWALCRRDLLRSPVSLVTLAFVATLVALDVSGRNLSEVARLWLFLTPFGSVALAKVLDNSRAATSIVLIAIVGQTVVALAGLSSVEPLLPIQVPISP